MKWKNVLILILLLGFVTVTIYYNWPKESTETVQTMECLKKGAVATKPEKGSCAPNFQLQKMGGGQMELYRNNGKPTFINFWASWCSPCREELPYMDKAYQQYKDRINFAMVNATTTEPDLKNVEEEMKKHKYQFPVYLDTEESNVSFEKYQAPGIPVTVAVDKNGKIIEKVIGSITEKQMQIIINKLLTS